jgi:glycosyltransferase involved in cell wall biosynthesis
MRILIVAVTMPYPPASGGEIRIHGVIEGLRRAPHDITLLTFHEGALDESISTDLRVIPNPPPHRTKWNRLKDLLFTRQPDIAGRFYSSTFETRLHELLMREQFDLIQFEGIESVRYLLVAKQAQPSAKLIFDTFNAEYALQRGIYQIDRKNLKRFPFAIYSFLQIARIKRFERKMCRLADAVIAVSQEDADLLRQFRGDQRIYIVPNGVWVDRYANGEPSVNLGENALVFTGKMDYRPNVDAMLWFTEEIFPRIKTQILDAKLVIVGQKPHERLSHLQTMTDVIITGWVKSVSPYLRAASVYIAPLRMGSGTRLKLLEAMACECAIVATSTASAGLRDETRRAMIVADSAQELTEAIVELLSDPQRREQLGVLARQQVTRYYDWSTLIPQLLNVYTEIGLG